MNADELVAALLALDIELRQLLDAVEADMTETWEADAGETPRCRAKAEGESEEEEEGRARLEVGWRLVLAKALTVDAPHIPSPGSVKRLGRFLRPRAQLGSSSETTLEFCEGA